MIGNALDCINPIKVVAIICNCTCYYQTTTKYLLLQLIACNSIVYTVMKDGLTCGLLMIALKSVCICSLKKAVMATCYVMCSNPTGRYANKTYSTSNELIDPPR